MKVNEIFYSLQGEGHFTGTPSVFVRLSGCNLKCPFCDTKHESGAELSEDEIVEEVCKYTATHVVITGGEPALQINDTLIYLLHKHGRIVQVETNGTKALPVTVDWVTCSPKYKPVVLSRINELKVVFDGQDMSQYDSLTAMEYYLQPCDWQDNERNAETVEKCINYIKENPKWKLSLQTQKILNVR